MTLSFNQGLGLTIPLRTHVSVCSILRLEMLTLTHIIGGIYRDSSGKLWSIYLDEADDQDEEMTEYWLGEADSILLFVSVTISS